MDVSIIVPYYNRNDLFGNQLESIVRNDYPREKFELVLVEDGSLDYSQEELDRTGLRAKYVWNEKKDPSIRIPPRNKGIEVAEGDLMIFLDCDQILQPDFIRNHVEFHQSSGREILQIGTRKDMLPDQDVTKLDTAEYDEDVRAKLFRTIRSDGEGLLAMWANVWSHNISIRSEHVRKFGGFDDGFRHWGLEDQEFGLRMQREGIEIRYNPAIEVHHQYHKPAWGAKIRDGWMRNCAYLLEKYPDDPAVRSILLMGEILDPSVSVTFRIDKVRDLSLPYYMRMEIVCHCLAGKELERRFLDVFPEDPSVLFRERKMKW